MITLIKRAFRKLLNRLGFDLHRISAPLSSTRVAPVPFLLPKIPPNEIANGDSAVFVVEPEWSNGNVSLLELLIINTLIAKRAPKVLFEIGTFDGRTSMNMVSNAVKSATLYTLDLPKDDLEKTVYALHDFDKQYVDKTKSGLRFAGTAYEKQIIQLYGDSAKFDFSPYYGKMEFIFIDGSHAYEYVKNDTAVALKLAADSALIIWHDYDPFWMGVVQALDEFLVSGGIFQNIRNVAGTTLAVMEFSRRI
jgi:predicted O-methyltransferase YrrM